MNILISNTHLNNPGWPEGILRDGEMTSRSQSMIDVEDIPIFEATAKTLVPWQQILVSNTEKMNI